MYTIHIFGIVFFWATLYVKSLKGTIYSQLNNSYKCLRGFGLINCCSFPIIIHNCNLQWYKKMANLTPLGRKLTSPDEVASVVMFLASDMSRAMTGQRVKVDRGALLTNPMVDWREKE